MLAKYIEITATLVASKRKVAATPNENSLLGVVVGDSIQGTIFQMIVIIIHVSFFPSDYLTFYPLSHAIVFFLPS